MPISPNNIITYQDLITATLAKIKTLCVNIDKLPTNLPSAFKNGAVIPLASQYFSETRMGWHWHMYWQAVNRAAHTSTIKARVSEELLTSVSSYTVENDFLNFLKARNIYTKLNELVSFKIMMTFYNNLASFLSAKTVYLTSTISPQCYLFYKVGTVNYPAVNLSLASIDFTPTEVNTCITDLLNAINNTIHTDMVNMIISYACSSCSSSSSSSCSSSSSSSSSMFIAYMDI